MVLSQCNHPTNAAGFLRATAQTTCVALFFCPAGAARITSTSSQRFPAPYTVIEDFHRWQPPGSGYQTHAWRSKAKQLHPQKFSISFLLFFLIARSSSHHQPSASRDRLQCYITTNFTALSFYVDWVGWVPSFLKSISRLIWLSRHCLQFLNQNVVCNCLSRCHATTHHSFLRPPLVLFR
jgi:hypothetical protein